MTINGQPANAASPSAPTTNPVTLYAVTQYCGKKEGSTQVECNPISSDSTIGMMGVGFQSVEYLQANDRSLLAYTNALAQIP
ncbi:hypothetical protein, partial [Streptomyces scabiei]|uniref:hypothetical protein n=1 Tax=Streptomyces scabiei TaxID=1930 RepID=UPI0038F70C44